MLFDIRFYVLWTSIALALMTLSAEATWKPIYGESPQAWIDWFTNANTTEAVHKRLGWEKCCSHSDRFVTSFKHDDHWYYQRDGRWVLIPDDTVEPEDPTMPQQLKEEGVLFIYQDKVTCFWPPETGG
jgi:hypothetical protein